MTSFLRLEAQTQAAIIAATVSVILAAYNLWMIYRLEKLKGNISNELAHTKAMLDEQASAKNARQSYEFDARKRLYTELEPLLFQLFDAAEGSLFRVKSLVRTQRNGNLREGKNSWVNQDGYYLISTIYRIFLPLAIFRLIQRKTTFVDLSLDESIRARYMLLKQAYLTFTDDFLIAKETPNIKYDPKKDAYDIERYISGIGPRCHWPQALVIGNIDRLLDFMSKSEGEGKRPLTYGEFEDSVHQNGVIIPSMSAPFYLFYKFDFFTRPILARILHAHACLMHLLIVSYQQEVPPNWLAEMENFLKSDEHNLCWWNDEKDDPTKPVIKYLTSRPVWTSLIGSHSKGGESGR